MNPTVPTVAVATDLLTAGVGMAGALVVVLAYAMISPRRRTRPTAIESKHPPADAVSAYDSVVRELRSGLSLRASLVSALAHHPQVTPEVLVALRSELPLSEALDGMSVHHDTDALFVHGLRVCVRTGTDAADVLDRAVVIARERRAWLAERRAQAAQARLSAWLLTLLPMVFAGWGLLTSARVRDALVDSPVVGICISAGCGLNLIGWWWMRRLVDGSTR